VSDAAGLGGTPRKSGGVLDVAQTVGLWKHRRSAGTSGNKAAFKRMLVDGLREKSF